MDPSRICKKTRRLKGKQNQICRNEPDIVTEISKGAAMGTKECHHQFRNRRWNCTTARKSMRKVLMRGKDVNNTNISCPLSVLSLINVLITILCCC